MQDHFITQDGTRIPRTPEEIVADLLTPRPPRPPAVREGVLTSAEFQALLDEVDRAYIGERKIDILTNTKG